MADAKTVVGVLLLVVSLSAVYVSMQGVRIRADTDKSTFYVKEGGRWVVSGEERMKLFNGSTQLTRNVTGVIIDSVIDNVNKTVTITRTTPYTRGPVIKETYFFDGAVDDVARFPISHEVEVFNASGMLLRYEASRLTYSGVTYKLGGETILTFGRSMKLSLEPGYRWAWVYASGTVKAQYGVGSDYEAYGFRLYDPDTVVTLYLNGTAANATIETGEPVNITAVSNNTGLLVCLSINHTSLGENFTCGATRVEYTWNPTASLGRFNDSAASKMFNYSLKANQTAYLRLHSYDRTTNVTLNLTGVNTTATNYPSNVKIYINDTLSNSIAGTLKEGVTSLDAFNDSSMEKNMSILLAGSQTVYLSLPKNAVVTDAKLNISGYRADYINATGSYGGATTCGYGVPGYPAGKFGVLTAFENVRSNVTINGIYVKFEYNATPLTSNSTLMQLRYWDNDTVLDSDTIDLGSGAGWYKFDIYANLTYGTKYYFNITVNTNWDVSRWANTNTSAENKMNGFYRSTCIKPNVGFGTNCWYGNPACDAFNITFNDTYVSNPYIDIEGDGTMEWNWTVSNFSTTNATGNVSANITHYLGLCAQNVYGNCIIPMTIGYVGTGKVRLSALNVTYTASFNPIVLNRTHVQNFLDRSAYGYQDVPIRIEASQGNVSAGNLSVVYNGSAVFNVTAFWQGNATHPAASAKLNLTTHYSNFTAAFPLSFMTEPVFLPLSNSSRNVSAYGQTASVPEYNITGKNYGQAMNLSIRLNQSMDSCMNMTVGINNTVYNFTLNATRRTILSNITVNQSAGLWLKLNLYNCNSSTAYRNWWVELESCCYRCLKCWG